MKIKFLKSRIGVCIISTLAWCGVINSAAANGTTALLVSPTEGILGNEVYIPGTEEVDAEEMRVVVLGSGLLPTGMEQAASCVLVELGNGDKFVFDVGSQCHNRIAAQKIPYDYMDKVFLSRLHVDNFADLATFWLGGTVMNRLTPLRIWGPSGETEELGTQYIMDRMFDMYLWDRSTRGGVIDSRGMVLDINEFDHSKENQVVYKHNDVIVRAFPATEITQGSVAYVLEWNGLKFGYAGSSRGSQAWVDYVSAADVVIHEAAAFGETMARVQPRLAVASRFSNKPETAQILRQDIARDYQGSLALAVDYLTINTSINALRVRAADVDTAIWPSPPVREKVAEVDKLHLLSLLTGYSQSAVLPMPEVLLPLYNEMNEKHGTDYYPINNSLLVKSVKQIRAIGRAVTGDDPATE